MTKKAKQQHESFADAFVSNLNSGLNWARNVLAAASREFGAEVPEAKVINAHATQIKDRLTREGFTGSTLKNRPSVARKILRVHTVLDDAVTKVDKSTAWTRPKRGFDQQTFEKIVTVANRLLTDGGKMPTATAVANRFIADSNATPKGKTPSKVAEAAFKRLVESGTTAAKWVAVIEAAQQAAAEQGINIAD